MRKPLFVKLLLSTERTSPEEPEVDPDDTRRRDGIVVRMERDAASREAESAEARRTAESGEARSDLN